MFYMIPLTSVNAMKLFTMDRGHDFILNNYNRVNMDQRKIILSALRKYVMTDELNKVTFEFIEEFWDEIKRNGLEKPIDMPKYFHLMVTQIMAKSLFGAKYSLDNPELMYLKSALKRVPRAVDVINLFEGLPDVVGQFLFNMLIKTSWMGLPEIMKTMETKYQQHLVSYEDGKIRDVVDALIAAKEEAILEDKETAAHLNDLNLTNILSDMFIASIDTTSCMSEWVFLLMAKYPEMQSKMRREIREMIGQRMPTQQDKDNCHFTMAFIHESLRLHAQIPLGVAHHQQNKTNVEIGRHKIPGQTTIISYLHAIQRNAENWSQPDKFDPNRMLDADGKLQTNKLPAFLPFGSGRRACPGEKLAQIDGFLIVARMLQLTDQLGLKFVSDGPVEVELDPSLIIILEPKHYKLLLKKRLNNSN